MKKLLLSFVVVLIFGFFVAFERSNSRRNDSITEIYTTPLYTTPDAVLYATPQTQTPAQYKDGEYTGPVTDAFFGPFQVKVIIKSTRLADIEFLQYPNDRRTSIQINTQAMPLWKQQAIVAQSANVDIVTGATQSSEAFQKSLASALAKAR